MLLQSDEQNRWVAALISSVGWEKAGAGGSQGDDKACHTNEEWNSGPQGRRTLWAITWPACYRGGAGKEESKMARLTLDFKRKNVPKNVGAGLPLAMVAIPDSIALAILAGVNRLLPLTR